MVWGDRPPPVWEQFPLKKKNIFLRELSLHDWVGADRAHGKEVEDCEEDQHCLLKLDFCKL